MRLKADRGRVGGTAAAGEFAEHRLADRGILFGRFGEIPCDDVFFLDHCRTGCSVDLYPFQVAGIRGGCRLDRSERAVFEAERGDGGILNFNPFMGQKPGDRGQLLHRPHQPEEQVDRVDRLIHQRAAAVERPGAAPAAAVVILLGPVPFDDGVPQSQLAEPLRVDRLFQLGAGRVEAARKDGREGHSRLVARVDDPVAPFECHFERLFDDDVFPRLGGHDRRIHVRAARRADCDNVDRRVGQHLFQILIRGRVVLLGEPFGRQRELVVTADQFASGRFDCFGVEPCDHAAADNPKSHFFHVDLPRER